MLKNYFKQTVISQTKISNAHQTENTFCLKSVLLNENEIRSVSTWLKFYVITFFSVQ